METHVLVDHQRVKPFVEQNPCQAIEMDFLTILIRLYKLMGSLAMAN
jgi:hypothetical protein